MTCSAGDAGNLSLRIVLTTVFRSEYVWRWSSSQPIVRWKRPTLSLCPVSSQNSRWARQTTPMSCVPVCLVRDIYKPSGYVCWYRLMQSSQDLPRSAAPDASEENPWVCVSIVWVINFVPVDSQMTTTVAVTIYCMLHIQDCVGVLSCISQVQTSMLLRKNSCSLQQIINFDFLHF